MPNEEKSPAELLLRAVDTLPKDERDRVLTWLIAPAPRSAQTAWELQSYNQGLVSQLREMTPGVSAALRRRTAAQGEELQVVPVRLTGDQHAVLREWCQDHGFSMATVIRGLVSRFLDGQGAASSSKETKED
ncbi:hypothetical protein [Streptomyces sp. RPT161]|uniref:hypothetical protein n=1 Tax=Streptomyces sp. RPT161 TaxID=3015993 RepID=UPI0022B9246D|nr:hypothetical protein [Streptomyces sp. RPT161]